jgi:hypothetical protein
MVVHTCNPTLGRLKQEGHKFEASLDYVLRLCLRKTTEQTVTFGKSVLV